MNQFAIKLAWNSTLMGQSCNPHEISMRRGLKVIKVQTFIHLKTAPKVLKMMDKQLMLISKLMIPRLRHKRGQLSPTNMTSHGMIKASKKRIFACKIGPQKLLIWQAKVSPMKHMH